MNKRTANAYIQLINFLSDFSQVLKYHYVGLKPKFAELEQALLFADSSMNPTEIVLTYFPADN